MTRIGTVSATGKKNTANPQEKNLQFTNILIIILVKINDKVT